jgi:hypothetical protein
MPPALSGSTLPPRGKGKASATTATGSISRRSIDKKPDSGDAKNSKHTNKLAGKYAERYKYIRFVEKKKVIRKMRQLQQQLVNEPDSSKKELIETELAKLRQDLMYIEKYPGDQKYISLFPSEGNLSEECLKKQKEIREMIIKRTANAEKRANMVAKLDVIKSDDFFTIPGADEPNKQSAISATKTVSKQGHHKPKKEAIVHPSWDAKKNNQKLTGSIANQQFEGKKITFDDDE